ncbi:MAG: FAD-dependent oxidoreductase [Rhodothermales bacterium]
MSVIIVGDGPAGLSAALFLAKKDMDVTVFGKNETAMHYARLYNYLGIEDITGTDFQQIARKQVDKFGAKIIDAFVSTITVDDNFVVTTEDKSTYTSKYLIIAEGKGMKLCNALGLSLELTGIKVDRDGKTDIDRLYVVGRGTKLRRSQAIISAGEGASTALDILSVEAGKDVLDYDSVN